MNAYTPDGTSAPAKDSLPMRQCLSILMLAFSLLGLACSDRSGENQPSAVQPTETTLPLVESGWARATPPGAKVGAAYLKLYNPGSEALQIVGATFAAASRTEIHSMRMQDGMMRMRKLEVLQLPPDSRTALEPGGDHLMLMGLKQALMPGQQIEGLLILADGREVSVKLPVRQQAP